MLPEQIIRQRDDKDRDDRRPLPAGIGHAPGFASLPPEADPRRYDDAPCDRRAISAALWRHSRSS
jgi:hypothetical protein